MQLNIDKILLLSLESFEPLEVRIKLLKLQLEVLSKLLLINIELLSSPG